MEHWSNYWNTAAALNSFAEGSANDGYDHQVKAFWHSLFATLPKDAQILDVGCGNGAIALMAAQYSKDNKKGFRIEGADQAKIEPSKALPAKHPLAPYLKDVTFHSGVGVEELPHTNASLDALVSQFAIEYANLGKAATKIADVVKPGGVFAAIIHDSGSALVKSSRVGIKIISDVLDDTPLFLQTDLLINLATQGIPQLGKKGWAEYSHNKILSQTIKWTMDTLLEKYKANDQQVWIRDIIGRVARSLQLLEKGELKESQHYLNMSYHLLDQHRKRLQDQDKAALTEKSLQSKLVSKLEKLGFNTTVESMEIDGDKFAWALTAKKS